MALSQLSHHELNLMKLPAVTTTNDIPYITHLTWKSTELPTEWQPSYDNWLRLHPEWTVILWTDEQLHALVSQHYPASLATYESLPYPIMRVDFARLFLLHRYGGVYIDLDIAPKCSFSPLVDFHNARGDPIAISESSTAQGARPPLTNALMMSRPNEPFWIDIYADAIQNPHKIKLWFKPLLNRIRHWDIIMRTGPQALMWSVHTHESNGGKPIARIPNFLTQPSPHWEKRPASGPGSMVTILEGGSWHSLDSKIATQADFVWNKRQVWVPIVFACLVVVIGILSICVHKLRK